MVADHFEQAQFLLLEPQIDRGDFDRQHIGRVLQPLGDSGERHGQHVFDIVGAVDHVDAFVGDLWQALAIIAFEHRELRNQRLGTRQLTVGHYGVDEAATIIR